MRVVVADNRPGIPADVRQRIFEPFFTTKGESGTGLGLWIASDILRKYDGVIKLRTSTRPHCSGTCFSIFPPFQVEIDAAVQSTPTRADANSKWSVWHVRTSFQREQVGSRTLPKPPAGVHTRLHSGSARFSNSVQRSQRGDLE
jgi:hypothetical protein